jgi:ATP-dependent RNA helicase DHX29
VPGTPHTPRAVQASRTPAAPKTPKVSNSQFLIPSGPILARSPGITTPGSSSEVSPAPTPRSTGSSSILDATAPAFIPSSHASPAVASSPAVELDEKAVLKARILESVSQDTQESTMGSGRESPESDDPHHEYVKLKLQIDDFKSGGQALGGPRDDAFFKSLQARLIEVQNHYFFDRIDAEQQYREARKKADALALQERLREDSNAEPTKPLHPTTSRKRPPNIKPPSNNARTSAVDGTASDSDSSGGMLELLDGPPAEEVSDGVTIIVRDMGPAKQWTGRTPKVLLAETVTKVDRYAAITYRCISGHSRAKRAAVSIRGDGGKNGSWSMNDVACHDLDQVSIL